MKVSRTVLNGGREETYRKATRLASTQHDDAAQHKRPRPSPGPGGSVGDLPWPPCQGSIPDAPAPSRATHGTAGTRPGVVAGLALGHASDRHAVAFSPCVERVFPASPGRASLEELLVGKRIVSLAAIAENDVVDDGDTEELSSVHEALGQGTIFLAGLRRPRGMVMAAEQGRGIAQDRRLHDFAWMDHAGGQRAY